MARTDPLSFGPDGLDAEIHAVFEPLCRPVKSQAIADLKSRVDGHLAVVLQAARRNEFLDVAAAGAIHDVLSLLLEQYEELPAEHQALVAGAALYFVRSDDAEADLRSVLGLDDDVAVVNFVLDAVGWQEWRIEL